MTTQTRWTLGPDSRRCTETVLNQFGIFGRAPRNGSGVIDALMAAGFRLAAADRSGTVAGFCVAHPEGRFYFATEGHALALIDGLLVDSAGDGPDDRPVIGAFLVTTP